MIIIIHGRSVITEYFIETYISSSAYGGGGMKGERENEREGSGRQKEGVAFWARFVRDSVYSKAVCES